MIFNIPLADIIVAVLGIALVAVFIVTVLKRKNCKCGCDGCKNREGCSSCGKCIDDK